MHCRKRSGDKQSIVPRTIVERSLAQSKGVIWGGGSWTIPPSLLFKSQRVVDTGNGIFWNKKSFCRFLPKILEVCFGAANSFNPVFRTLPWSTARWVRLCPLTQKVCQRHTVCQWQHSKQAARRRTPFFEFCHCCGHVWARSSNDEKKIQWRNPRNFACANLGTETHF